MKLHHTIAFKVIIRQDVVDDTLPDNKYVFLLMESCKKMKL